ncbi:MAG: winged helix-turn-helix transcriptional regulator [Chloroflexi bacterium]|nr:winged helix-turn-helix transcriptional regulator [Chloroflexota bacterium]
MREKRESTRELGLLEEIERDPDTTQASMADKLGVAVGTVNWHLKRLIAKGYVKVKRAERKKLRYIITPEGILLRANLTMAYIENSMNLYRQTRKQALEVLKSARKKGYEKVMIAGEGDIADVCRLTSLEQGFPVVQKADDGKVAVIKIGGSTISLKELVEK